MYWNINHKIACSVIADKGTGKCKFLNANNL